MFSVLIWLVVVVSPSVSSFKSLKSEPHGRRKAFVDERKKLCPIFQKPLSDFLSDKGFFLARRLWFSTAILSLILPSKNGLPSRKIGPTYKSSQGDWDNNNDSLTPLGNGNELIQNVLMLSVLSPAIPTANPLAYPLAIVTSPDNQFHTQRS